MEQDGQFTLGARAKHTGIACAIKIVPWQYLITNSGACGQRSFAKMTEGLQGSSWALTVGRSDFCLQENQRSDREIGRLQHKIMAFLSV